MDRRPPPSRRDWSDGRDGSGERSPPPGYRGPPPPPPPGFPPFADYRGEPPPPPPYFPSRLMGGPPSGHGSGPSPMSPSSSFFLHSPVGSGGTLTSSSSSSLGSQPSMHGGPMAGSRRPRLDDGPLLAHPPPPPPPPLSSSSLSSRYGYGPPPPRFDQSGGPRGRPRMPSPPRYGSFPPFPSPDQTLAASSSSSMSSPHSGPMSRQDGLDTRRSGDLHSHFLPPPPPHHLGIPIKSEDGMRASDDESCVEELLQEIEQVDIEITKVDIEIEHAKKEGRRSKMAQDSGQEVVRRETLAELIDRIYTENQKIVASVYGDFERLQHPAMKTTFTSVQDYPIFQRNLEVHQHIKERLTQVIRERVRTRLIKEKVLHLKYRAYEARWRKWLRSRETQQKKRLPDSAFDELIGEYQADDDAYYYERRAVPLSMVFEDEATENTFSSRNGYIEDCYSHYFGRRTQEKAWTVEEKDIFLDQFKQHFKDFWKISKALPNKTCGDVVCYYYNNKKSLGLKAIMQQQMIKKRGKRVIEEGGGRRGRRKDAAAIPDSSPLRVPKPVDISSIPPEILMPPQAGAVPTGEKKRKTKWTKDEKKKFKALLSQYGTDFLAISLELETRNQKECRAFFKAHQKGLKLDEIVSIHNAKRDRSQIDQIIAGTVALGDAHEDDGKKTSKKRRLAEDDGSGKPSFASKEKEKEKEKEKGHAKDKDKDKDKSPLKLVKPFSLQIPMLAESGVKASVGSDGEPLPTMTTPPPVGGTGTETAVPEGMVDSAKVSTLSSHASSEIPPKFNMVDATKEWMRQHNLQRETEKEKKDKDKDIDEKKGDTVRTGVTDVADDMQLEEHPPVDVQQKPTEGEENEQEAQEVRTEPVSEKSEQGKMPLLFEVPLVMEDLKAVVSHTMQKATILPTEMEHDRTEMKDDGMDVEPTTHHVSDLGESGSQLVEKSEDVLKTHEKSSEMGVMPSTAMEVEKTEQFSFPEREEEAKVSLPDETAPEEAVETAWTDGMNTEIHTSDQPNVEDVEKPAPPPDELKESEIMEAVEGVDENRVEEHQPSSSTMDVEGPLPPCLGEEKTTGAMSTIPHDELSTEKSPGEARREESVSEEVEMQEQAVEGNEVVEGQGEDKATHDPSDATISESEVLLDKDAASRDDAEFLIEEELSMKENSEGSRLDAVAGEKRESTMDSDTITEDVVPGESRSPLPQADSIPINHRSSTLDGDPSASVDEEKHIETVDQLENTEESLNEKTQTTEEFPRDDQPSKTSSSSREQETTVVRDEPSGDLEKEV